MFLESILEGFFHAGNVIVRYTAQYYKAGLLAMLLHAKSKHQKILISSNL